MTPKCGVGSTELLGEGAGGGDWLWCLLRGFLLPGNPGGVRLLPCQAAMLGRMEVTPLQILPNARSQGKRRKKLQSVRHKREAVFPLLSSGILFLLAASSVFWSRAGSWGLVWCLHTVGALPNAAVTVGSKGSRSW